MDLAKFLNDRLDEDEAAARAASEAEREPWQVWEWEDQHPADVKHYGRHGPGRVLREVDAKRKIVALAALEVVGGREIDYDVRDVMDLTLKTLAAIYSDHSDYDKAWEGVDGG